MNNFLYVNASSRKKSFKKKIISRILKPFRIISFIIAGKNKYEHKFYSTHLLNGLNNLEQQYAISDHLGKIFFFAMQAKPKLIVELGTRGGDSTKSLLTAAYLNNAILLSIDINDCGDLKSPYKKHWRFKKADDIEFGKKYFTKWCNNLNIFPNIDVLFIDSSHEYLHTKQEIETWFQFLSSNAIVMFHDTNMGKGIYSRTNKNILFSWDNKRGVIRAIEEFLDRKYEENNFFYDYAKNFLVYHFPYSSGFTVLNRLN